MYTDQENTLLIIVREGTRHTWQEIANLFNWFFGTAVTARNLTDKYRRLKGTPRAWALDRFLKSCTRWVIDPCYTDFIVSAVTTLSKCAGGFPLSSSYRHGRYYPC